jgi:alkanesulfonate monooxygenase SsuD/methylene tetrahydromethanopterin reductase-like flavin-dependent oxidoreductase (luciferase family)
LLSCLHFRTAVTLAQAVMTVDHISGRWVELALGVGDPSAGEGAARVT